MGMTACYLNPRPNASVAAKTIPYQMECDIAVDLFA